MRGSSYKKRSNDYRSRGCWCNGNVMSNCRNVSCETRLSEGSAIGKSGGRIRDK
jgi:hypothetical protein